MPLESASFISDLEVSNPGATDLIRQTDDHIRLIKSVLLATFPNLDAAVTSTPDDLNTPPFSVPVGLICVWYGSSGSVPSGWAVCNGATVNRSDDSGTIVLPDLRDRVVIGAGTIAAQGITAGAATATATTASSGAYTPSVSGAGTVTVDPHALTVDELPAHTHTVGYSNQTPGSMDTNNPSGVEIGEQGTARYQTTTPTGAGAGHSHTASISFSGSATPVPAHTHTVASSTIQPVMGLHYIMKV